MATYKCDRCGKLYERVTDRRVDTEIDFGTLYDLIGQLIDWCDKHNILVGISFGSDRGQHFVKLDLTHHGFRVSHIFDIYGGVFNRNNWEQAGPNKLSYSFCDLEKFLKEAEEEFYKLDNEKGWDYYK